MLTAKTLFKSIIQGVVIFGASFGTYLSFLHQYHDNAALARTMGLTIILLANVLLVQIISSNTEFAFKTMRRLSKDKVMWAITLGTFIGLIVILYIIYSNN